METRGASVNFQRVTAPAHAVAHNRRGIAPPSYLLPKQFRLGTIEVIDDRGAVSKAFTGKMALASARSRKDETYSPIWEGVVNLPSPSGDLDEYRDAQLAIVKNWCREYELLTGHRVLRADIHLDEGHVRDGVPVYNAHAHVIVDRTNERGRVIKLDRGALRTVQSMTAHVTGLRRGKDALETGDTHLSHHAYRALARTGRLRTQQQVQEAGAERSLLVKERDRAQEAEREARAATRVAKAEAKELYTLLRDVMKASGIAEQQDYQDAKQIKLDVAKLTDAIMFWREKAGDPPGSLGLGSAGGDSSVRRSTSGRVAEQSASTPRADQRETHDIYMELYHSMKSVGRIADQVPAGEGLRAEAPAYPEAKRRSKADDREWLIAQLAEWRKRLLEAERLEAEAAGALRDRARDAEAAAEEEKRDRAAERTVHRRRRTYRPGFGGQGLGGADRFPFVELRREWDERARCTAYKAQDGQTWFVTTRNRVEVINQTDRSLVVALKVAAKKFGGRIECTGPQEFRERAARLATRLGIEVADADLQHIIQAEKAALAQSAPDHRGPAIGPQSGPDPDADEHEPPRGHSR